MSHNKHKRRGVLRGDESVKDLEQALKTHWKSKRHSGEAKNQVTVGGNKLAKVDW